MSRHLGSERRSTLRVARVIERTDVLGPGRRGVVVVQGCHLRCRGCIAEATHPLDGGFEVSVAELAARLSALSDLDGLTLSGGEPFLQAAALTDLIDTMRHARPNLSLMSYSGYRLEWLRGKGSSAQRELLGRLDLLIDGPYVARFHAPLRWRGSHNQRIHALSERHRGELDRDDVPAGMEMSIDPDLAVEWVGVPPLPGFLDRLLGGEYDSPDTQASATSPQEVVPR